MPPDDPHGTICREGQNRVVRNVRKLDRVVAPPLAERVPTKESVSLIIVPAHTSVAVAALSVNTKALISPNLGLPENREWL